MWHGWVLLATTCMLLLSCEWKEQCLETSQAVINVLSWKYYVVPPCSPTAQLQTLSTVQHQQAGDSSLHLSWTKMAGLHALTFATGGVVLYSDASCGQQFVFCFAHLARFSYSHLKSLTKKKKRKWGIAAHSPIGFSKGMFCNRSALLRVCQSGASGMLQAGKLCLWCVNPPPPGCAMRL